MVDVQFIVSVIASIQHAIGLRRARVLAKIPVEICTNEALLLVGVFVAWV